MDVIESEIGRPTPTVLAGVIVPDEDLFPGQFHTWTRALDHIHEADHRRRSEFPRGGSEREIVLFEDLGLAVEDKHDRSANVADIERFVILVEHQNCSTHSDRHLPSRVTFARGRGID